MKKFYEVHLTYAVDEIREVFADSEDDAADIAVEDVLDDPNVPSSVGEQDIDVGDVYEVDPPQVEDKEDD